MSDLGPDPHTGEQLFQLRRDAASLMRRYCRTYGRLDRLGRSIRDLLRIVDGLDKSGANFICLKERFDTSTAAGRLIFHCFAALAQFENELVRERTMAGITAARARGRLGGRSRLLTPQQAKVVETMWDSHDHTR